MRQYQRDLWVLQGILTHDLSQEQLEIVKKKHQIIDTVPSGYFYPELYVSINTSPQCVLRNGIMQIKAQHSGMQNSQNQGKLTYNKNNTEIWKVANCKLY